VTQLRRESLGGLQVRLITQPDSINRRAAQYDLLYRNIRKLAGEPILQLFGTLKIRERADLNRISRFRRRSGCRDGLANFDDLEFDGHHAGTHHVNLSCCGNRQIDHTIMNERPAIVDPNVHAFTIRFVGYPDERIEG